MKRKPKNLVPTFIVGGSAALVLGLMVVNLGTDSHSTAMTGGAAAAAAILHQLAALLSDL